MSNCRLKIIRLPDKNSIDKHKPETLTDLQPPFIIGRGAVFKCAEKKVSRNHATIDWDDDGVIVTATHSIPTYTKINGEVKILNKGESTVLKDGDQFGLLQNSFWYKISLKHFSEDNEIKDTNGASKGKDESVDDTTQVEHSLNINDKNHFEDVKEKKVAPKVKNMSADVEPIAESALNTTDKNKIYDDIPSEFPKGKTLLKGSFSGKAKNKESTLVSENKNSVIDKGLTKGIINKEESQLTKKSCIPSRERQLPSWLQECKTEKVCNPVQCTVSKIKRHGNNSCSKKTKIDSAVCGVDGDVAKGGQQLKKNDKKRSPVKRKSDTPSKSKSYHSVSQDYEDFSGNIDKNIQLQSVDEEGKLQKKSVLSTKNKNSILLEETKNSLKQFKDKQKKSERKSEGESLHSVSDDDSTSDHPPKFTPKNNSPEANTQEHIAPDDGDAGSEDEEKKQRTSCLFGAKCYRRNPQHRKEYAHPGDKDFLDPNDVAENDSDDGTPQCEFGVDCYRKNPQHKKAYKHTRLPQPRRRAARAKRKRDEDYDSEDDYDSADPFLNDDSSDDYAPTDSDTDSPVDLDAVEEEDTKRMLKEAKKFAKKQKS